MIFFLPAYFLRPPHGSGTEPTSAARLETFHKLLITQWPAAAASLTQPPPKRLFVYATSKCLLPACPIVFRLPGRQIHQVRRTLELRSRARPFVEC